MSNPISSDCSSGLHEYCTPCECECHKSTCNCKTLDRKKDESEREWLKRCMCMFHWMQTDYYRNKLEPQEERKLIAKDFRHPDGFGT